MKRLVVLGLVLVILLLFTGCVPALKASKSDPMPPEMTKPTSLIKTADSMSPKITSQILSPTSSASTPPILAYYYVWYGCPEHTDDWETADYPLLGYYDSGDPKIIKQHIAWAKKAGINGFIISWWGKNRGEEKNAKKVFQECPQDFKLAIMVEQIISEDGSRLWHHCADLGNPKYREDFIHTMDHIVNTFYKSYPESYLKWHGKPVIVCYAFIDRGASEADYTLFFEEAKEQIYEDTGVEVSFWSINTADCLAFDVCAMYNPKLQAVENEQCPMQDIFYRCKSGVKVATVFPGYDDTAIREPGIIIGREGGNFYRRQWRKLLEFAPDIVFIDTWNEWHEGTEIEPTKTWGNLYLNLTSEFIRQLGTKAVAPNKGAEEKKVLSRFSPQDKLLFVARDEKETGYCEFCQLVPFKKGLFFFNGPHGKIYRIDPVASEVKLVYEHPYERSSDHWRATCWGSCVTKEQSGEGNRLFFAGFAIDEKGNYRPYVFRSDDGEHFRAFKVADFSGEAYCIFHFVFDEKPSELYVFVGDDEHGKTKVFKAKDLSGESWELVYTVEEKSYRIGGAIEWFGHLWAVGQTNEPGDTSSEGIILDYDSKTGKWSHKFYNVGFFSIAKVRTNAGYRVYIGDTKGWIWVTWNMPPSEEAKLIKLDAPVLRLQWLTEVEHYSSNLIACTGLRNGWGSLWLLEGALYPKRLVQNAYGGITGCAPFYNGVAYTTAWDTAGSNYHPCHQAIGGRGAQTAKVGWVSPEEIARTFSKRDYSRQIIWNKAKIKAGDQAIISTLGWDSFEVSFKADSDGTLTIEYDGGADPETSEWIEAIKLAVKANEAILTERLPVRGIRARISFDHDAEATALVFLHP